MAPVFSPLTNLAGTTAQAVLSRFFAAANTYVNPLADAMPGNTQTVPHSLVAAITRYGKGFQDRPLLLPFSESGAERTCWFVCAHDELSARGLHDEMVAFVGPSFGDFENDGAVLSATQESAKSVLTQSGLHVTAFFAITSKFEQRVIGSWQRYWQLLEQRPARSRQELRTFHQLRAAFDRALVARNERDAMAAMAALRDQHGLSAENRAFLEIRLHATLGRWDRILAHPQWDDLLKVRLPPETYGDVWDALYETYVAPLEVQGVANELVGAFAQHVRIMAADLLKGRGRSRRPAALKSFLLHELSVEKPSAQLCASLLQELGPSAFGPSSDAIAFMARTLQPKSGLEQAQHEIELERYEQALALLQPLPDSTEVLQAQLRCAKEIGHPGQASAAIHRLLTVNAEIATRVRQARPRLLADVEKLAAQNISTPTLPGSQSIPGPGKTDDILVYWREVVHSPEAAAMLEQSSFVQSLLSTIEDVALDASPLFEYLLPILFDWLVIRNTPASALVRVYLGFIEALHVRDRAGESEREMVRLATRHALIAGLTPAEYKALVNRLGDVFSETPSPREIAWGLDLADLLVIHPCRDDEARLRWTAKVVQAASQSWTRLSIGERCLLELLAQEAGLFVPLRQSKDMDDEVQARTDIKARIFLYSLDTQAIRRAAVVLEAAFPQAKIDINSDEACTQRLKTGSRHADWVVFVSGVATHQAFFCIKAALRADAVLLQVDGSGTTRIVERVIRQSKLVSATPTA
ncbi:hypothetical protein F3J24_18430 [Comamonas sp. Tr-654]|uniref:protein DpdD n=1 Tax=Comamonas sp. Tr-654 TaxID=2608341 RepID=UPI0027147739|nr:protein DpdD [Comamonas sp. Tr-654]NIF85480.1 hypothetical protein [Comamonas sp. Tr-654]